MIHLGIAGDRELWELAQAHATTHTVLLVDRPEDVADVDTGTLVAHRSSEALRGSRVEECAVELLISSEVCAWNAGAWCTCTPASVSATRSGCACCGVFVGSVVQAGHGRVHAAALGEG